jgi:hypothetical protein
MTRLGFFLVLWLCGVDEPQQPFPEPVADLVFTRVQTATLPDLLRDRARYSERMSSERKLTLPESLEVARIDLNGDGVDEFVLRSPQELSGGPLQHVFQRWSTHPKSRPEDPDSFQPIASIQGSLYFGARVNGYFQIISQVQHPDRIEFDREGRASRSRSNQYTRRLQRFEGTGYQTVRLADYRKGESVGSLEYVGEPGFVYPNAFPVRHDWQFILEPNVCPVDSYCGRFVQELKHSAVPTPTDARGRAWNAGGPLDARSSWNVTALLRIVNDDDVLGPAGSFVWEVRLTNSAVTGGTERIVWVGTQTGKVKMFP